MKYWVFIVICLTSSGGMADDVFISVRSVWPGIDSEMSVGSARGDNHTKNKVNVSMYPALPVTIKKFELLSFPQVKMSNS